MIQLASKSECTGCLTCVQVCAKKAIITEKDANGLLYPVINDSLCVKCGTCEKSCPIIKIDTEHEKIRAVYAAWQKDDKKRASSNSGGVCAWLAEKAFVEGYSIFGAIIDDDLVVRHKRIASIDELERLKMSKYVQSDVSTCLQQIAEELSDNRSVMFFGTPCQTVGVRNAFRKFKDRVITVDLICHGVPAPKYLEEHLTVLAGSLENITEYCFRDNNKYTFTIRKRDNAIISSPVQKDTYLTCFMKGLCFKESCYYCKFSGTERYSDFTIGDFWGIKFLLTEGVKLETRKGINAVLVNTDKAESILSYWMDDSLFWEERELAEVVKYQPSLRNELIPKKDHEKFVRIWKIKGFEKACIPFMRKYRCIEMWDKIRRKFIRFGNCLLKTKL